MKFSSTAGQLSILLILASLISFSSCSSDNTPVDITAKSGAVTKDSASQEALASITQKSLSTTIQLPGEFRPFEYVDIYPKANGFVKQVNVDRGSVVRKGQVLVVLEAPEINQQALTGKAEVAKAKEIYMNSKDKYDRLVQASKTPGAVAPYELQSAKSKMESDAAGYEAQKASYAALNVSEDYLIVRAPFDGVITQRNIHPGALVGPSSKNSEGPMLVLQQENKLRLVVHVPEAVSSSIKKEGEVGFTLTAQPGKEYHATISRRSGAINTDVRSEAIEVDVTTSDNSIKPGMYAEVKVPLLSSSESFLVPSSSVVHSTQGNYIVAVDNQMRKKFINVQEGLNMKDSVEIFGALKDVHQILKYPTTDTKQDIASN